MAALGNLLQSGSQGIRNACGAISGLLLVLALLKAAFFPQLVREDLKNPVTASVSAAFPMALTLLSVYLQPWLGWGAYGLWLFALGLHAVILVCFTGRFLFKLKMEQVFASYFIVYVGIASSAVTAPAYGRQDLGAALVCFALAALAALFVLITWRYIRFPQTPESAKPLLCIYTAPTNLCIVGYIQSVETKSPALLLFLLGLAAPLYLFALRQAIRCLKMPFYPSYAAFTFPFVVSAVAVGQSIACLAELGVSAPWLEYPALAETAIAAGLTFYTLARYLGFLFDPKD
jgi:exfoliative toxin A/B